MDPVLILIAVIWSPIGYGRAVLAYRRLAGLEREESESRRATALADERRRLARELHDTVAGHLSAVAILAVPTMMAGIYAPSPVDPRPLEARA